MTTTTNTTTINLTRPAHGSVAQHEPQPVALFHRVQQQFDRAAEMLELAPEVRKILARPMCEVSVTFPVRMDDGRLECFTGYRDQHNNALGPFKGGIRYHPDGSIDEVRALPPTRSRSRGSNRCTLNAAFSPERQITEEHPS